MAESLSSLQEKWNRGTSYTTKLDIYGHDSRHTTSWVCVSVSVSIYVFMHCHCQIQCPSQQNFLFLHEAIILTSRAAGEEQSLLHPRSQSVWSRAVTEDVDDFLRQPLDLSAHSGCRDALLCIRGYSILFICFYVYVFVIVLI